METLASVLATAVATVAAAVLGYLAQRRSAKAQEKTAGDAHEFGLLDRWEGYATSIEERLNARITEQDQRISALSGQVRLQAVKFNILLAYARDLRNQIGPEAKPWPEELREDLNAQGY